MEEGGVFADEGTWCKTPIDDWGVVMRVGLAVGIEFDCRRMSKAEFVATGFMRRLQFSPRVMAARKHHPVMNCTVTRAREALETAWVRKTGGAGPTTAEVGRWMDAAWSDCVSGYMGSYMPATVNRAVVVGAKDVMVMPQCAFGSHGGEGCNASNIFVNGVAEADVSTDQVGPTLSS